MHLIVFSTISINQLISTTTIKSHGLPLSYSCIEQRSLIAWVCPHQKQEVSLFKASNPSVEKIVWTQVRSKEPKENAELDITICWPGIGWSSVSSSLVLPSSSHWKSLFSAQVVTVKTIQQIFEGNESLCIHHASNDSSDIISFNPLQLLNKRGTTETDEHNLQVRA